MVIFTDIMNYLLIFVFVSFIVVLFAIGRAILNLKNEAVRTANRLSGPVKSTKNIIAAGKGVYDQDAVRVRRIIKRGTITVGVVAETAVGLKVAAEGIKKIDFAAIQAHSKEIIRIINLLGQLYKAASRQKGDAA
jgi:hypothetical protein